VTTSKATRSGAPPTRSARSAALKMLALRRLTEAQLWKKLEAKGYSESAIAETVAGCRRDGFLDDALFATLFVEGARRAVGDARLVVELVKRGIEREAAAQTVAAAPLAQDERIVLAYEKLRRTKPQQSYAAAARALERLGFPTSLIYRTLREHASSEFSEILESV
jgi:SOS response regulatory protein OraA/RecX